MVTERRGYQESNQIIRHKLGNMDFEMIHQTMPGDCVLINYLNTYSLTHDGMIPMSPRELRDIVIEQRRQNHETADDIVADNTRLSYEDVVRLFSTINNSRPKQEDIMTIDGRTQRNNLKHNVEYGLLEYLDSYESGLCTTGMGNHSRTIWKLSDNIYIVIDPSDPNGFNQYNKQQLVEYLTDLCSHQEPNNNFFFL